MLSAATVTMDSGFLAEPVIGPATSGRTRWRGPGMTLFLREFQAHFPIPLRIVAPAFAHFDEQEEMHRLLDRHGDVLARRGADRSDRLAALAEDDFALAFALDIDRLLDAHGAVAKLLPDFGLDSRLIGQFLMQPQKKLFAGDLGGKLTHRRVGDLVLRIKPRSERHMRGEEAFEIGDAAAGARRDHE